MLPRCHSRRRRSKGTRRVNKGGLWKQKQTIFSPLRSRWLTILLCDIFLFLLLDQLVVRGRGFLALLLKRSIGRECVLTDEGREWRIPVLLQLINYIASATLFLASFSCSSCSFSGGSVHTFIYSPQRRLIWLASQSARQGRRARRVILLPTRHSHAVLVFSPFCSIPSIHPLTQ